MPRNLLFLLAVAPALALGAAVPGTAAPAWVVDTGG